MSIKDFSNQGTEDIFFGRNTAKARRQADKRAWKLAQPLLFLLNQAARLSELSDTPGLRLEPLKWSKPGYYSIRVTNQYRIVFIWKDGNAYEVSVEDPKHHQP